MNPESENLELVRRLLVLKKYEQPPPGYFDGFSANVIAGIRAEMSVSNARVGDRWIKRFWAVLEAKPIFAGAFGVAVCTVLISGMLNSEEPGLASGAALMPATAHINSFADGKPIAALNSNLEAVPAALSTNPISSLGAAFETYPSLNAEPASFRFTIEN